MAFVCYLLFIPRCIGPEGPWQQWRVEAGVGNDLEGAKAAAVQLAGRTPSDSVPGIQPNIVAGKEARGGKPLPIGTGGSADPGAAHFSAEMVGECPRCCMCTLIVGVVGGGWREVALPGWVAAIEAE